MNENIENLNLDDFLKNGCLIQKPFSQMIYIGCGLIRDESGEFFLSNFYNTEFQRYSAKDIFYVQKETFLAWLSRQNLDHCSLVEQQNFDKEFQRDVLKCKNLFEVNTNLKKLVAVTRCEYKNLNQDHPLGNLVKLSSLEGFLYGLWHGEGGFIGVSPEPLFVRNGDRWQTVSLAGTIDQSTLDFRDVLLNDRKERNEHQFVIDDMKQSLSTIADEIKQEETKVVVFGPMAHLKTDLSFKLKNDDTKQLTQSLSPSAALGGHPKAESLRCLKELNYYEYEKDQRYFGGVMGLSDAQDCFGLVAIRNLFWDNVEHSAFIHSGCGIVKESQPDKELLEVQNKRHSIEKFFL